MIENGVIPEQILLLTFTNKAAREMKDRAALMLDERCSEITACTYHSFCSLMLRKYADRIGWNRDFSIINDGADIINVLKTRKGYNKYRGFPQGKTIVSMISSSTNKEIPLHEIVGENYSKYDVYVKEIEEIAEAFSLYKREHSLMDYDDLLVFFFRLIDERQDIRDIIASQYKYIMVDEYQDTNNLQERIILKLREKVKNIAVVGDDYQSIYAFRGSNVNNILEFSDKMENVKTIKLEQNYRSGQPILDVANNMMLENATQGVYKAMYSTIHCEKPFLYRPNTQFDERDVVIDIIRKELQKGTAPEEIAVLERKSNESALIEAGLVSLGIPFVKYGGLKFFDRSHIQDVMAFLRVIANPHDEIAWFRVLKLYPGIGENYSQKLSQNAISKNETFLIENSYKKRTFYKELTGLHAEYNNWKNKPYTELVSCIIQYYHDLRERYIRQAKYHDESDREVNLNNNEEALKDLQILKTMSEEYNTLNQFLDAIILDATQKEEESGIVISTIHSAKGLEYEVVILLDCVDGEFPFTTEADYGSDEDNEELRCCYVAITRAKRGLHIMSPIIVRDYRGYTNYVQPSHFLNENYLQEAVV